MGQYALIGGVSKEIRHKYANIGGAQRKIASENALIGGASRKISIALPLYDTGVTSPEIGSFSASMVNTTLTTNYSFSKGTTCLTLWVTSSSGAGGDTVTVVSKNSVDVTNFARLTCNCRYTGTLTGYSALRFGIWKTIENYGIVTWAKKASVVKGAGYSGISIDTSSLTGSYKVGFQFVANVCGLGTTTANLYVQNIWGEC